MKKMKLIHSALTVGILGLAALAAPLNANATASAWDSSKHSFATDVRLSAGVDHDFDDYMFYFYYFGKTEVANGCPPGTRHYRTNGLFGLGARDIGCMSPYEAESLRRQNYQNVQNNINQNRQRHCTTNFIAGTAYTNCY